jgi:hypothetical protein
MRIDLPCLALLLAAVLPPPAHAAESYDNCKGFITTLPAVITTQGTWCMNKDLSTAQTTGAAISVQTNNVIIDCNGFKLGGLGAGLGTSTIGISGADKGNIAIRRCNVRGFHTGAFLGSALGGYLVEDNRFDNNTVAGLSLSGDGSTIRGNQVLHTGGSTLAAQGSTAGITASGAVQIVGNQVHDVAPSTTATSSVTGIHFSTAAGGRLADNVVSGVFQVAPGTARSLWLPGGAGVAINRNALSAEAGALITALACDSDDHVARDNTMIGHDTGLSGCHDGGGNVVSP